MEANKMSDNIRYFTRVGPVSGIASVLLILIAVLFSSGLAGTLPPGNPRTSIQAPPPTPKPTPAEDTTRYVEWLARKAKAVEGKPREDVSLRVSDWGFFEHRSGPWQFGDRAALDRSGHVVVPSEQGDWLALLGTSGLDPGGALKRVAWLFGACGIDPLSATPDIAKRYQITTPTLTSTTDGVIFQGWVFLSCYTDPPNTHNPSRITINATSSATKIVTESPRKS
jgi:hypothetical protein